MKTGKPKIVHLKRKSFIELIDVLWLFIQRAASKEATAAEIAALPAVLEQYQILLQLRVVD